MNTATAPQKERFYGYVDFDLPDWGEKFCIKHECAMRIGQLRQQVAVLSQPDVARQSNYVILVQMMNTTCYRIAKDLNHRRVENASLVPAVIGLLRDAANVTVGGGSLERQKRDILKMAYELEQRYRIARAMESDM